MSAGRYSSSSSIGTPHVLAAANDELHIDVVERALDPAGLPKLKSSQLPDLVDCWRPLSDDDTRMQSKKGIGGAGCGQHERQDGAEQEW